MPIFWKTKILLLKTEVTYGVDPTPTGAANAILATNVEIKPMEGQDVSRDLEQAWLGGQPTIPAGLYAVLSGRVELAPSGSAGTAPGWGPMLRACGVAQTIAPGVSVTYNPVTDNQESATAYLWIGGTRYKIRGARGTGKISANAQGIPYFEWTLTGLFEVASEQPRVAPTLTAFQKPQLVTSANTPVFTIDAVPLVMRSFAMNLGNDVQTRFLVGSESVLIVDRAEQVDCQVKALPLTTWNPFQKALDQALVVVGLTHGVGAGKVSRLQINAMQVQRPNELKQAQNIKEWVLRGAPQPTAGNDQWTLTLT